MYIYIYMCVFMYQYVYVRMCIYVSMGIPTYMCDVVSDNKNIYEHNLFIT